MSKEHRMYTYILCENTQRRSHDTRVDEWTRDGSERAEWLSLDWKSIEWIAGTDTEARRACRSIGRWWCYFLRQCTKIFYLYVSHSHFFPFFFPSWSSWAHNKLAHWTNENLGRKRRKKKNGSREENLWNEMKEEKNGTKVIRATRRCERTHTNTHISTSTERWVAVFLWGMATQRISHKNNCLSFSCANVDVYYTWNTDTRSSRRKLRFPSLFTSCRCFSVSTCPTPSQRNVKRAFLATCEFVRCSFTYSHCSV